jgi:hypothetical protein
MTVFGPVEHWRGSDPPLLIYVRIMSELSKRPGAFAVFNSST